MCFFYTVIKKCVTLHRFYKQLIVLQIKSKEMKKLVLMFVAVVALSFASCGNKPAEAPAEAEAPVEEVAEPAEEDSCAADSAVADTTAAAEEEAPAA